MNHFSGVIGNFPLTMFCDWLHFFPTGTGTPLVRPIVGSGWSWFSWTAPIHNLLSAGLSAENIIPSQPQKNKNEKIKINRKSLKKNKNNKKNSKIENQKRSVNNNLLVGPFTTTQLFAGLHRAPGFSLVQL